MFPARPSVIDRFRIYGDVERTFSTTGLWSTFTAPTTKPFVTLYDSVEAMSYGMISPWASDPRMFATNYVSSIVEPYDSTLVYLTTDDLSLSAGADATWQGFISFHTGDIVAGEAIFDDASAAIDTHLAGL